MELVVGVLDMILDEFVAGSSDCFLLYNRPQGKTDSEMAVAIRIYIIV